MNPLNRLYYGWDGDHNDRPDPNDPWEWEEWEFLFRFIREFGIFLAFCLVLGVAAFCGRRGSKYSYSFLQNFKALSCTSTVQSKSTFTIESKKMNLCESIHIAELAQRVSFLVNLTKLAKIAALAELSPCFFEEIQQKPEGVLWQDFLRPKLGHFESRLVDLTNKYHMDLLFWTNEYKKAVESGQIRQGGSIRYAGLTQRELVQRLAPLAKYSIFVFEELKQKPEGEFWKGDLLKDQTILVYLIHQYEPTRRST